MAAMVTSSGSIDLLSLPSVPYPSLCANIFAMVDLPPPPSPTMQRSLPISWLTTAPSRASFISGVSTIQRGNGGSDAVDGDGGDDADDGVVDDSDDGVVASEDMLLLLPVLYEL